ncbi:putative glutamine amidotransferase [Sinorhizobium phage phiM6]|nr:putative glutamine amidotransferase [Sinorhizobium phage phiM6]
MCAIIHLPAETQLDKEHLYNCVYNNWHSWGLILKDANGKMQMLKDCPEKENDPELIWKMLEDNKDIERVLHLRHTTRGETNMENAQPFEVYSSDTRQVFFAHNGTLYKFGESNIHKKDTISDTRDFCDKILRPSLLRWTGENGKGDYTDKLYWDLIVKEHWAQNSKGIFVSNDLPPRYVGDGWSTYKSGANGEIKISNNDYFKEVTRGPEKDRRDAEARRARLANGSENFQNQNGNANGHFGRENGSTIMGDAIINGVKVYRPHNLEKSHQIKNALDHLHTDVNFHDMDEVAKTFFNLTFQEWQDYVADEGIFTIAALLCHISDAAYALYNEKKELETRNERLDKRLQALHIEFPEILRNKKEEDKAA